MPPEQGAVERLTHWVASIGLEDVVRYATAGLAAVIVGVPAFKKAKAHIWEPLKEVWTSGRDIFLKLSLAIEGAAMLKPAVARFEGFATKLDAVMGRITNIEATIEDVRGNNRAEFLATHEPRLRFDEACRLQLVNPSGLAILGLSRDEAEGMGWKNAIVPSYREKVVAEMRGAAEDQRHATITFPVQSKGGTKADAHHYELSLVPITSPTSHSFGGFLAHFVHMDGEECGLPSVCPLRPEQHPKTGNA